MIWRKSLVLEYSAKKISVRPMRSLGAKIAHERRPTLVGMTATVLLCSQNPCAPSQGTPSLVLPMLEAAGGEHASAMGPKGAATGGCQLSMLLLAAES